MYFIIRYEALSLFDKKKSQLNNADNHKFSLIDIRVTVQSLSQRVHQLEDTLQNKNKIIETLKQDMASLQTGHEQLERDYEYLRSQTESKFSKYDSAHKLSNQQFKRLETDNYEIHGQIRKTDNEIKRISKVASNFQKQINSKHSSMSYADAVSPETTDISTSSPNTTPTKSAAVSTTPSNTPLSIVNHGKFISASDLNTLWSNRSSSMTAHTHVTPNTPSITPMRR